MKKVLNILFLLLLHTVVMAQSPQVINSQLKLTNVPVGNGANTENVIVRGTDQVLKNRTWTDIFTQYSGLIQSDNLDQVLTKGNSSDQSIYLGTGIDQTILTPSGVTINNTNTEFNSSVRSNGFKSNQTSGEKYVGMNPLEGIIIHTNEIENNGKGMIRSTNLTTDAIFELPNESDGILATQSYVTSQIPSAPSLQLVVNTGNNIVSGNDTTTLQADQVRTANSVGSYADLKSDGSLRIGRYVSGAQRSGSIIPNPATPAYTTQQITLPALAGTLVTEESLPIPNLNQVLTSGGSSTLNLEIGSVGSGYSVLTPGQIYAYSGNSGVYLNKNGTLSIIRQHAGVAKTANIIPNLSPTYGSTAQFQLPDTAGILALKSDIPIPSIPSLQQVTDNGNNTTNDIFVKDNLSLPTTIATHYNYAFNVLDQNTGKGSSINNLGELSLSSAFNRYGTISRNPAQSTESVNHLLPATAGTLALLTDIPAPSVPSLQQVTDNGNVTSNIVNGNGGFSTTWANGYLNLGTNYGSANVRTFDYFSTGDDTDFTSSTEVLIRANVEEMIHLKASNPDGAMDFSVSPYEVTISGEKVLTAPAVSYSTIETKTGGTWIDGKPIYRKVLSVTFNITGDGISLAHGISDFEKAIECKFINRGTTRMHLLGDNVFGDNYITTGNIELEFGPAENTYDIILEYTKTTD